MDTASKWYLWLLAGTIYGATTLVKPHSILFLPGVIAYITFIFINQRVVEKKILLNAIGWFTAAWLIVKLSISYYFAGIQGITVMGEMYNTMATSKSMNLSEIINLMELTIISFWGHISAVGLMYGAPMISAFAIVYYSIAGNKDNLSETTKPCECLTKISFLAIALIINLLIVTSVFTGKIATSGPYESPYRLHMRYYNFALPLFYIVAAGTYSQSYTKQCWLRNVLCFGMLILLIATIYTKLAPYTPTVVDSPEIYGVMQSGLIFKTIGCLSLLSIVLWLISKKMGLVMYLMIFLPFITFTSQHYVQRALKMHNIPTVYDNAGIAAKKYFDQRELAKVLVVGSDDAGIFKTMFYLDTYSRVLVESKDNTYHLNDVPGDKEWVIVLGDTQVNGHYLSKTVMDGYTFFRVRQKQ